MKYLMTDDERRERGGTAFLEFRKGKLTPPYDQGDFWREDSVYLSFADWKAIVGLRELFAKNFPSFDFYGISSCDEAQWRSFVRAAEESGGRAAEVVRELDSVVSEWLPKNVLSILGL